MNTLWSNEVVHQFVRFQAVSHRDRKQQSGIGHQVVIVEGDLDAIEIVAW